MKSLYTFLIFLFAGIAAVAQRGTISGKISTAEGNAAVSVTVSLQGTGKEVLSAENGSFTIGNVKPGAYTLVVSHIGLKTQEKAVTVTEGLTIRIDLTLFEIPVNWRRLSSTEKKA